MSIKCCSKINVSVLGVPVVIFLTNTPKNIYGFTQLTEKFSFKIFAKEL